MTKQKEALRIALNYIENQYYDPLDEKTAVAAIKEALAQETSSHSDHYWAHEIDMAHIKGYQQGRDSALKEMAKPKPVAWLQIGLPPLHGGDVIARTTKPKDWNPEWWRFEPLYTHPKEWQDLTNKEILEVLCIWPDADDDPEDYMENIREARAILKAAKEKNT